VSKIKSPQEKKGLSLERDRRNTYGENSKGSRESIPRGKQRSHMRERRAARTILGRVRETVVETDAIEADDSARVAILKGRRSAFRKYPDQPLAVVVKWKLERRQKLAHPVRDVGNPVGLALYSDADDAFDTPYAAALHKRDLMLQVKICCRRKRFGKYKETGFDVEEAAKWRKAILRDAPLLKGFFADEPQWRDRMLRWCEETLNLSG